MKRISILIPCYNEETVLPSLYSSVKKVIDSLSDYEWDFLFVDDGSTDATLPYIKALRQTDERVHFISLSRNFGKEI